MNELPDAADVGAEIIRRTLECLDMAVESQGIRMSRNDREVSEAAAAMAMTVTLAVFQERGLLPR